MTDPGRSPLREAAPGRFHARVPHPLLAHDAHPIVGHRGNAAHAPENTLVSFRQAVALGVDALEFDVRLSADGVPVVHHDATVDRTTDGTGAVAALSLAALQRLDAGARFTADGGRTFPYRGQGITIPTVAEVLAAVPDTPLLIELKVAEAATPLRRVLEGAGAMGRCIVASFLDGAVAPFAGTGVPRGASKGDLVRLLPRALLRRAASSLPYEIIAMPTSFRRVPLPMAGYVRAAAGAGVPVHVWTVNEPAEARRLWAAGVRGLISDDPGTMLALRAQQFGGGR